MVRPQQLAPIPGWEREEFDEETKHAVPDMVTLLTRFGHITPVRSKRRVGAFQHDVNVVDDASEEIIALNRTVRGLSQKIEQLASTLEETNRIIVAMSQSYFWTPEWQAKERQADQDETAGASKVFTSAEDLIKDLNS